MNLKKDGTSTILYQNIVSLCLTPANRNIYNYNVWKYVLLSGTYVAWFYFSMFVHLFVHIVTFFEYKILFEITPLLYIFYV